MHAHCTHTTHSHNMCTHTYTQMEGTNGQSQHNTQTLCNTLWGHNLSFHPFLHGDDPIPFSSLLPNNKTFLETYRDAHLEKALFELCQLLVATNSVKSLECLLEQSVLQASQCFKTAGKVTLAHLVCAVGTVEMVTMLQQRCGSNSNGIWTKRDEEGVCLFVCVSVCLH